MDFVFQTMGAGAAYGAIAGAAVASVIGPEIMDVLIENIQRNGANGPIGRALAHPPCERICGNALCGAVTGGLVGFEIEQMYSESG